MHSSNKQIAPIIASCIDNKREAQKELYKQFYSYGMSVCIRYANTRDEAVEIMNDGFLRVFTYLKNFDLEKPFHPWFRKIIVNCAIDHFRKQNKHVRVELEEAMNTASTETFIDSISYDEMLALVQRLSPAYRTVFNLYAIEGYKHEEIAQMLGISVGTSKSNYAKAKRKLQEYLYMFFEVDK